MASKKLTKTSKPEEPTALSTQAVNPFLTEDETNDLQQQNILAVDAVGDVKIPPITLGNFDFDDVKIGYILGWGPYRANWNKGIKGDNTSAPDCLSLDSITGVGDPGGECAKCKWNVPGTGFKGPKGVKCPVRTRIRFLPEDEDEIYEIRAPQTSGGNLKSGFLGARLQKYPGLPEQFTCVRLTKGPHSHSTQGAFKFKIMGSIFERVLADNSVSEVEMYDEKKIAAIKAAIRSAIKEGTTPPRMDLSRLIRDDWLQKFGAQIKEAQQRVRDAKEMAEAISFTRADFAANADEVGGSGSAGFEDAEDTL